MDIDNNIQKLIQDKDLTNLKISLDSPHYISTYPQLLLYAIKKDASLEVVNLLLNYIDYKSFFNVIDVNDINVIKNIYKRFIFHNNFIDDFIHFIKTFPSWDDKTTLEELSNYFYITAIQINFYAIKYLLFYETEDTLRQVNASYNLFSLAVEKNQLHIVRYLIGKGITGKDEPRKRDSIIYTTFKKGYINMANLLLSRGAITITDEDILDIIKLAIRNNNTKILECLQQNNININEKKDKYDNMPLHFAIRDKKLECINYLLENGAPVNIKNKEGQLPLFMAYDTHDPLIISTLIMHNANLNEVNNNGETILFLAVKDNNIELVKFLIQNDVNVNVKDKMVIPL